MVGLQLLRDQGQTYGAEQVFTYGPWGFLSAPTVLDLGDVWIAGIFRACVIALLFGALYACLPAAIWRAPAAVILTLLLGNSGQSGWLLTVALASVVLAHLATSRTPTTRLLAAAAVLSALAVQIKISDGVLSVAVVGLLTLTTRRPAVWLVTAGSFCAASVAWWVLAGQFVPDLGPWLRLSYEIVGGYGEAMAFTSRIPIVWIMIIGTVVASLTVMVSPLPLAARLCSFGIIVFVTKAALTRPDGPHVLLGYGGLVLVLIVAFPRRVTSPMGVIAAPVMTVMVLVLAAQMPILPARNLSPGTLPLDAFPAEHSRRVEQVRADLVDEFALDDALVAELRGHPVSIDPWEISVAWAYDLEWSPLPVFQSYSAYTPRLDEANATALLADPEHRVLREIVAYNDANPFWTTPRSTMALTCNFNQVASDDHWSVLARGVDRCGPEESVSTVRVKSGESVDLPQSTDSLIAVRFAPDARSLTDRALGAVTGYQRDLLFAAIDGTWFRLAEALAGGPLIVSVPAGDRVLPELEAASSISFDRPGRLEIVEIPLRGRESE